MQTRCPTPLANGRARNRGTPLSNPDRLPDESADESSSALSIFEVACKKPAKKQATLSDGVLVEMAVERLGTRISALEDIVKRLDQKLE